MGIKGLFNFLNLTQKTTLVGPHILKCIQGKRLALDGDIFLFAASTSGKVRLHLFFCELFDQPPEPWAVAIVSQSIKDRIKFFRNHGAKDCILILDGPSNSLKRIQTEKRRNTAINAKLKFLRSLNSIGLDYGHTPFFDKNKHLGKSKMTPSIFGREKADRFAKDVKYGLYHGEIGLLYDYVNKNTNKEIPIDSIRSVLSLGRQVTSVPRQLKELVVQNLGSGQEYPVLVAPNESDSQLVYMQQSKHVDIVVSEDTDLLALGCDSVLFKACQSATLSKFLNSSFVVHQSDIFQDDVHKKNMKAFNDLQFFHMCVLAGCDYFSIPYVGMNNAYDIVLKAGPTHSVDDLDTILREIKSKKVIVPETFRNDFQAAVTAFRDQNIYNFDSQCITPRPLTN